MKRVMLAVAAVGAAAIGSLAAPSIAGAALPPPVTTYDATHAPLPGNVVSVGFESNSVNELGNEVTFDGTARLLNTVTVTMSSWACQQGGWSTHDCVTSTPSTKAQIPVTLNIYAPSHVNGDNTVTPGSLLLTTTQTFAMPYRPTANINKCNNFNGHTDLGKWYSKADGKCYNGKAFNITYVLRTLKQRLPDTAVITVTYNTTNHGANPIGTSACNGTSEGCFYDSLNVGTDGDAPTVGADATPGTVFQNTTWAGELCDGTPALGVLNQDSPTSACWGGYEPNFKVTMR